jgi:hypothetical protein
MELWKYLWCKCLEADSLACITSVYTNEDSQRLLQEISLKLLLELQQGRFQTPNITVHAEFTPPTEEDGLIYLLH